MFLSDDSCGGKGCRRVFYYRTAQRTRFTVATLTRKMVEMLDAAEDVRRNRDGFVRPLRHQNHVGIYYRTLNGTYLNREVQACPDCSTEVWSED